MPRIQHAQTAKRARVVLSFGGAVPQIEDSDNVRSVTEVDSKGFVVHFGVPFLDEPYRCDVIPSEPIAFAIKTRSKDGVGIQLAARRPKKWKIVCEAV